MLVPLSGLTSRICCLSLLTITILLFLLYMIISHILVPYCSTKLRGMTKSIYILHLELITIQFYCFIRWWWIYEKICFGWSQQFRVCYYNLTAIFFRLNLPFAFFLSFYITGLPEQTFLIPIAQLTWRMN